MRKVDKVSADHRRAGRAVLEHVTGLVGGQPVAEDVVHAEQRQLVSVDRVEDGQARISLARLPKRKEKSTGIWFTSQAFTFVN